MTDTRALAEAALRTLEARDWPAFAALLHEDVVYEMPQSRERIIGRDRYVQFNVEYPGDWHLTPSTIVADGSSAVVRFDWRVGDEVGEGVVFYEVTDGLITHITDFWPEPFEPRPGREHLVERF